MFMLLKFIIFLKNFANKFYIMAQQIIIVQCLNIETEKPVFLKVVLKQIIT